jgi:hypothetical protein
VRKQDYIVDLAIVSANNHYAGTANIFRKMVGLPEAQFSKDEENKKEEKPKNIHWLPCS